MGSPTDIGLGLATMGLYTVGKAGYDYFIGNPQKQLDMQRDANSQAKSAALKNEKATEEATNRANQKRPDVSAIMSAAQNAAKTGGASTMLTGPQGIDPSALQLGKSSLLGS